MSQQTGESCGTSGGGCPTIRGIPLQLLLVLGLVVYTAAQGAWATVTTGSERGLLEAMARVERPYITALWTTCAGRPSEAAASVARLAAAWSAFEAERGEELAGLEGGASVGPWVSARIEEAASRVAEAPSEAHGVLEEIRVRLREVRVANGLEYFPDHLTAYHASMEAIVQAAASGGAAGPGADAVAEIRATLPEARARWAALEAAPHDNGVYGLTAGALDVREELLAAERAALEALVGVAEGDDAAAIARAGVALKPAFVRLVLLYGGSDEGAIRGSAAF